MNMRDIINRLNESLDDRNSPSMLESMEETLTAEELDVLGETTKSAGLEWWLTDNAERAILRKLKKLGLVQRGRADTKQGQVSYYITGDGYRVLERLRP